MIDAQMFATALAEVLQRYPDAQLDDEPYGWIDIYVDDERVGEIAWVDGQMVVKWEPY